MSVNHRRGISEVALFSLRLIFPLERFECSSVVDCCTVIVFCKPSLPRVGVMFTTLLFHSFLFTSTIWSYQWSSVRRSHFPTLVIFLSWENFRTVNERGLVECVRIRLDRRTLRNICLGHDKTCTHSFTFTVLSQYLSLSLRRLRKSRKSRRRKDTFRDIRLSVVSLCTSGNLLASWNREKFKPNSKFNSNNTQFG